MTAATTIVPEEDGKLLDLEGRLMKVRRGYSEVLVESRPHIATRKKALSTYLVTFELQDCRGRGEKRRDGLGEKGRVGGCLAIEFLVVRHSLEG